MDKIIKVLFLLAVFVSVGLLFWLRGRRTIQYNSVDIEHECYVWQRNWNDDLRESIHTAAGDIRTFVALAAEIDVRDGRQQRQIMPVDYAFLKGFPKPSGLAIRVNPYSGPFEPEAEASRYLIQTVERVLQQADDQGFIPSEIQIDYDCAESKLVGYRQWIQSIKSNFPQIQVIITALPSWMNNRQFKPLIQSCDGYVLQVHSLEKPQTFDEDVVLCDPRQALRWIMRADRFDVPFRVALPTYGYVVAYDKQGAFTGLSAEGPMSAWPHDTQIKTVLSDPEKIASMIQEIQSISPKNLSGVIWFRLPVAGDQLNWQWHTLQRLINNQPLIEQIEVLVEWPQPNLVEIYLVNSGDIDVSDALTVWLEFKDDCLAADGIMGYTVIQNPGGKMMIHNENILPGQRLCSQTKVKIAWCRFDKETEVKANVQFDSK